MTNTIERAQYYDTIELADLLGVSPATIRSMRKRGQGPDYVIIGAGAVRYNADVVGLWLAAGGNRKLRLHVAEGVADE